MANNIDVFLIGGQSNAVGYSPIPTPSPLVTVDKAVVYYNSTIKACIDPVGAATNNSPWPSFAQTYYNAMGRPLCLVQAAVGGTLQYGGTGASTWDTTGTLYASSNTLVTNCNTLLTSIGYTGVFRGILWCQGEADASAIHNTTETGDQYKSALRTMIANYRSVYGSTMPFYIFRTGTNIDQGWDDGYKVVRDAQEEVAAADPYTHIVFRGALGFETLHYYAPGQYNFMGATAARLIAEGSLYETPSQCFGQWTPAIIAATTPGTPVYTGATIGSYERIGRRIRASFTIQLSSWSGSPAGNVSIGNLPFKAANTANDQQISSVFPVSITGLASGNIGAIAIVQPNTTTASLYSQANTSGSAVTAANLGSAPLLYGNIDYHI